MQIRDIGVTTTLAAGNWFVSIQPIQSGNCFQLTSTPANWPNGSEGCLRLSQDLGVDTPVSHNLPDVSA